MVAGPRLASPGSYRKTQNGAAEDSYYQEREDAAEQVGETGGRRTEKGSKIGKARFGAEVTSRYSAGEVNIASGHLLRRRLDR